MKTDKALPLHPCQTMWPLVPRGARQAASPYRGTSLIRKRAPLGHYSRTMPRALWWSQGGGRFLMSEVPMYRPKAYHPRAICLDPWRERGNPRGERGMGSYGFLVDLMFEEAL